MNHFVFSAFTTFVSALLVAMFFLTRSDSTMRLFGIYWVFIAFWSSTVAFQFQLLKIMPDQVWGWLLHFGCILIPAIFLHFSAQFIRPNKLDSVVVIAAYLLTIVYIIFNTFSEYFTSGVSYRDAYAYPTPSILYPFYFLSFILMVVYGTFRLFTKVRFLPTGARSWLFVFLITHSIAYIGAMDNFFIMADIKIFPWYPYGLYPVLFYALVGGYALNKLFLIYSKSTIATNL